VADESRLSHAYLFVGPERVGRATTARRFAQALNCEAEQRPCGSCRSCRLIAEDKHADVEFVGVGGLCDEPEHRDHSADGSRDIRICQVRRLQSVVSLAPFEGRYRVLVIDPAEALTAEATNAFLKTLEEPPPRVVLVLICAREEALRETVRSRCRRIAFGGVPRDAVEAALRERWGASPDQAARLARLAQGRLGWAVAALQDERLLIDRERTADEIEELAAGSFEDRFSYAAGLGARYSREPQVVRANLDVWNDWWRDVLLAAAGRDDLASERERLDTLRSHAAQYGVAGAVRALRAVQDARRHLDEHASPTLALEVMLLELPSGRGRRS
jgi:DNA polymerase-3 subunit delta'